MIFMAGLVSMKDLLQKAGFEVKVRSNTEQEELDKVRCVLGSVLMTTSRIQRERLLNEWKDFLPEDIFRALKQGHEGLCRIFPY